MTQKEIDRIESAIRHIQTATDIDPWAAEIAVAAMQKQIDHIAESGRMVEQTAETAQNVKDGDSVFRQAAIDCVTYDVEHTIECLKALPPAAPSTAQTTETTDDWIPVERELPEDLAEVNVTWVNPFTKSKPFTASAVFYEGKWYWYSSVCADVLGEYGRNDVDKVDDMIEITAWKPFPKPYRGGDE